MLKQHNGRPAVHASLYQIATEYTECGIVVSPSGAKNIAPLVRAIRVRGSVSV